ncbi:unnamed protein product [Gongylonema pulchrum]|uniref:Uncharacterized protein n=1 Tax=Gongylonema pulchrum TaxID=637853 RepID=A0A183DYS0_9BILA|nr:unnamed protein product [Gongylonema pulchrum]
MSATIKAEAPHAHAEGEEPEGKTLSCPPVKRLTISSSPTCHEILQSVTSDDHRRPVRRASSSHSKARRRGGDSGEGESASSTSIHAATDSIPSSL